MEAEGKLVKWADWARTPGIWSGRIEGRDLGTGVTVLFFATEVDGDGVRLHVHDYDEVFIVREGRALFTVGGREIVAEAGDVVFGPAHAPHKFRNLGPGRLETTDIHLSDHFAQVLLDDPDA